MVSSGSHCSGTLTLTATLTSREASAPDGRAAWSVALDELIGPQMPFRNVLSYDGGDDPF